MQNNTITPVVPTAKIQEFLNNGFIVMDEDSTDVSNRDSNGNPTHFFQKYMVAKPKYLATSTQLDAFGTITLIYQIILEYTIDGEFVAYSIAIGEDWEQYSEVEGVAINIDALVFYSVV